MNDLLSLWFGLSRPVLRREYVLAGVGLMGLKYAVDAAAVRIGAGFWLTPLQFLSPLFGTRAAIFELNNAGLQWFLVLWALPFAWVGVSMSLRRAAAAGYSPWWGLLFFVPGVNYVLMLVLATTPDRTPERWLRPRVGPEGIAPEAETRERIRAALTGVAVGAALTVVVAIGWIVLVSFYGFALFLGAPLAIGAASAYAFNRDRRMDSRASIGVALVSVTLAMGFGLIFGIEGALCLAMAAPYAFGGAVMGAFLGRSIALAGYRQVSALWLLALAVPLLGWAEGEVGRETERPVFAATTVFEIAASPEEVWRSVIDFPALEEPAWWPFRLGIAYPVGATIEGRGVGAVRRCEFSTGAFVEPVTAWEPGRLLAFDVVENPHAMRELSPHGELVTAHLDSGFRAVRGEFRLKPLAGGTRLAGTTWYELDIAPRFYWNLWSNWIVHRIHERVLEHVKELAEAESRGATTRPTRPPGR